MRFSVYHSLSNLWYIMDNIMASYHSQLKKIMHTFFFFVICQNYGKLCQKLLEAFITIKMIVHMILVFFKYLKFIHYKMHP